MISTLPAKNFLILCASILIALVALPLLIVSFFKYSSLLSGVSFVVLLVALIALTLGIGLLVVKIFSHYHQELHAFFKRKDERQRQAELHEQDILDRIYEREHRTRQLLLTTQVTEVDESHLLASPREKAQPEDYTVPTAPSFLEMAHLITQTRLPLCWSVTGPAYGTVDDLLSTVIVGNPGRGKTTGLMYYVALLLQCGAEVTVWDPHGTMNELSELNGVVFSHMPETARIFYFDRKEDIVNSLPSLEQDLNERDDLYRRSKRGQPKQMKHPHLLLADELPVLSEWDEELKSGCKRGEVVYGMTRMIKRYVLEARKWRCYFIGSGQTMDSDVLPTKITENLSSRVVFFSSDRRARMSGLENTIAKKYLPFLKYAGSGAMIFDCPRLSEPFLGALPLITVENLLEYLGVMESLQAVYRDDMGSDAQPLTETIDSTCEELPDNADFYAQEAPGSDKIRYLDVARSEIGNASNRPVDDLGGTPESRPGKQYRFTPKEASEFLAGYKLFPESVEKVLRAMGKGNRYRAHAVELIEAAGLRKKA